jgi:hypothetical protein
MSRRLLITALSLSLSGVAGCATPVPGTTASPVETAQATAPTQLTEQPAAPGQSVPAGVAAAQTLALQGVVTFRGEALAGYGVKAYNPLTGAELPLASPIVTDGQGRFQANVTGLQGGQWVRVVATKGNVALEATTKADAQTPELALTEVATVLSLVADGPLKVAGLLNAEAIGPVADAYMAALADLRTPVAGALVQTPASANQVIAVPATDKQRSEFEGALETVVSNSGRSQALNDATFALLKAVAAAPHAKQFAAFAVQAADAPKFVRFLGTSFKAGIGGEGNTLQVANVRTGRMVDAAKASVEVFKTLVRKNKKRDPMIIRLPFYHMNLFIPILFGGAFLPAQRVDGGSSSDFGLIVPIGENPLTEDGLYIKDASKLVPAFDGPMDLDPSSIPYFPHFRVKRDTGGQPTDLVLTFFRLVSPTIVLPEGELTPVAAEDDEFLRDLPLPADGLTAQSFKASVVLPDPSGFPGGGDEDTWVEGPVTVYLTLYTDEAGENAGFFLAAPELLQGGDVSMNDLTFLLFAEGHRASLEDWRSPLQLPGFELGGED